MVAQKAKAWWTALPAAVRFVMMVMPLAGAVAAYAPARAKRVDALEHRVDAGESVQKFLVCRELQFDAGQDMKPCRWFLPDSLRFLKPLGGPP